MQSVQARRERERRQAIAAELDVHVDELVVSATYRYRYPQPMPSRDGVKARSAEAAAEKLRASAAEKERKLEALRELIETTTDEAEKWMLGMDFDHVATNLRYTERSLRDQQAAATLYRRRQRDGLTRAAPRKIDAPARTAPRARSPRRVARRSTRSSAASGDSPDEGGEPPVGHLRLAPTPRAVFTFGCLTATERGADIEQVER
jgi:hypothetical protein